MDHSNSEESDLIVDLERGGTTSEDDGVKDLNVGGKHARKMLGRLRSGKIGFDRSVRDMDGLGSSKNVLHYSENLEILIGNVDGKAAAGMMEMEMEKEKRKKTSSKKPPKPPRPPKSPSLDAADIKLVREISELARSRRARIEQRQEMKKKRADKASSSNANLIAFVITILFCFVIIFQGLLSRVCWSSES
ncbi:uncharacterized protein LOC132171196 isoform X1 [Corylus avellana]|uniref:uncharacterized protein LOC132171196 isoform X1 n=1 Tax=Corylus avellana TaxID=13451 RepID=UPI00286B67F2|nr:uncharacterized protein LOC132171196 isoform X1 [Corylus avellana]